MDASPCLGLWKWQGGILVSADCSISCTECICFEEVVDVEVGPIPVSTSSTYTMSTWCRYITRYIVRIGAETASRLGPGADGDHSEFENVVSNGKADRDWSLFSSVTDEFLFQKVISPNTWSMEAYGSKQFQVQRELGKLFFFSYFKCKLM